MVARSSASSGGMARSGIAGMSASLPDWAGAVTFSERSVPKVSLSPPGRLRRRLVRSIFGSAVFRRAAPVLTFRLGLAVLGINLAQVPLDSLTHQAGTGGPLADTLSAPAVDQVGSVR